VQYYKEAARCHTRDPAVQPGRLCLCDAGLCATDDSAILIARQCVHVCSKRLCSAAQATGARDTFGVHLYLSVPSYGPYTRHVAAATQHAPCIGAINSRAFTCASRWRVRLVRRPLEHSKPAVLRLFLAQSCHIRRTYVLCCKNQSHAGIISHAGIMCCNRV
jgi:hypothetical protein